MPPTAEGRGAMAGLPFPFTDLTTTKQRPAVIVSSDAFNTRQRDVLVVAVTFQVALPLNPEDHPLSSNELKTAGLPKPSIVKCGKLVTIDQRLIRKVLGRVSAATLHEIRQRLVALLD